MSVSVSRETLKRNELLWSFYEKSSAGGISHSWLLQVLSAEPKCVSSTPYPFWRSSVSTKSKICEFLSGQTLCMLLNLSLDTEWRSADALGRTRLSSKLQGPSQFSRRNVLSPMMGTMIILLLMIMIAVVMMVNSWS